MTMDFHKAGVGERPSRRAASTSLPSLCFSVWGVPQPYQALNRSRMLSCAGFDFLRPFFLRPVFDHRSDQTAGGSESFEIPRGEPEPARVRPPRQITPAGTRDSLGGDCGYEPCRETTGIICRFARVSSCGSVTAERSALSVAMTRREMLG